MSARLVQCALIGAVSMGLAMALGLPWFVGTLLGVLLVIATEPTR